MGVDALIALGGNLGDVRACFVQARASLAELPASSLETSSLLYRSPPMGPAGQTDYLNAVVRLKTSLRPELLLEHMQVIEKQHGRERSVHWGPRTLDLDLLTCGDTVSDIQELTLPHPHMHQRMFVLQPLCDINPCWRHPVGGGTAAQLLDTLLNLGHTKLVDGQPW